MGERERERERAGERDRAGERALLPPVCVCVGGGGRWVGLGLWLVVILFCATLFLVAIFSLGKSLLVAIL